MSEAPKAVVIEFGYIAHLLSLVIAVMAAFVYRRLKGQPPPLLILTLVLFVIYSANVIRLILFPIMVNVTDAQSIRAIVAEVNLSPFRSAMRSEQMLRNVALTIPLGMFWRLLFGKPSYYLWVTGVLIAASLEFVQLVTSLLIGAAYRSIDSLDLLLNVGGWGVGFVSTLCLMNLWSRFTQRPVGLLA